MCGRMILLMIVCMAGWAPPALGWWDEGHMQIAYLAYKRLDEAVKERADALLRRNPDYDTWTAGVRDRKTARLCAFIHEATCADDIKRKEYGYGNDKVTDATAGQNVAYDKLKHPYWHYKDLNFSPDNAPFPPANPVDLVTQLKLMIAVLPSASAASEDLRPFDLVWLLHPVGDAHQPLHAVGRFTKDIPEGDAGGNGRLSFSSDSRVIEEVVIGGRGPFPEPEKAKSLAGRDSGASAACVLRYINLIEETIG